MTSYSIWGTRMTIISNFNVLQELKREMKNRKSTISHYKCDYHYFSCHCCQNKFMITNRGSPPIRHYEKNVWQWGHQWR